MINYFLNYFITNKLVLILYHWIFYHWNFKICSSLDILSFIISKKYIKSYQKYIYKTISLLNPCTYSWWILAYYWIALFCKIYSHFLGQRFIFCLFSLIFILYFWLIVNFLINCTSKQLLFMLLMTLMSSFQFLVFKF